RPVGTAVVDDEELGGVVVRDGAGALALGDGRPGRVRQGDGERLGRLRLAIVNGWHEDGAGRLAWGERDRAGLGRIVATGRGRTIGRSVIDGYGRATGGV